jgi:hypothetical protein
MTLPSSDADGSGPDRVAVLPRLALALWIWEAAGLEPGEVAIYTSGSPADRTIAAVAGLRSVRDVVRLQVAPGSWEPIAGVMNRETADPQDAVGWLSKELRAAPGVVAAVLTPEAVAADILLEALPMWARIVLAMPSSNPATVDFYNNVHRKGTRIVSVPASPDELQQPQWIEAAAPYLARAARMLEVDRLASLCLP